MPPVTPPTLDVYLIAIGGTGMAPLACLLQELGHKVRGSDGPLYPPMSTLLEEAGIEPVLGPDPANLADPPDLVVVGNAVHRQNEEALFVEDAGIERISMPQAVARFLLDEREPLVIAGTHGKTTTTSMAATALAALGADPGWLIGGRPLDLASSFALGNGKAFVIEGDEYNAAYFDRGPKFLHYRARIAIITSVEYDHADLYPDATSFRAAFEELVDSLPSDGHLVLCADTPETRALAERARCPVTLYSMSPSTDAADESTVRPCEAPLRVDDRTLFSVDGPDGKANFRLVLPGRHNASNALAVWCALRAMHYGPQESADALATFSGVARRLQELGSPSGITVIDDFAHHPSAVKASLEGLRTRYPGRRVIALIEPRSLTAGRSFLHELWVEALVDADIAFLAPIFHAKRFAAEDLLDLSKLQTEVGNQGGHLRVFDSTESLYSEALCVLREGDVVVTMTSGAFDRIPARLLEDLAAR